jgi:UDPglucose--hexose-1-phosphate uridylyltransferase
MYPAVGLPTDGITSLSTSTAAPAAPAADAASPAIGAHEVIIESPWHYDRMSALSLSEMRDVLQAYATRLRHWRADGRFAYGLVFKNQGQRAGASLAHVHSQLIALPAVPTLVAAEIERAKHEYRRYGTCPYCRLIEEERAAGTRIVHHGGEFVAFCPFASLQPYEVWLMPAEHLPAFEDLPPTMVDKLAATVYQLIVREESIVPDGAYNLLLRTSGWQERGDDWCHWRLELVPRTTAFAGLELAAGLFINPIAPERAASKLRSI